MTTALAYKEFRETIGIATLGLAVMLGIASLSMGWGATLLPDFLAPRSYGNIPFLNDVFPGRFGMAAFVLAVALGLRQSVGDFVGDGYLFLLHRPVSRQTIFGAKLLVGLGLYLAAACVPVLFYAWYALLPGTHASPFDWQMTLPVWNTILTLSSVYFATFLSGIRGGNWFGTRLMPLVASLGVLFIVWQLSMGIALAVAVVLNLLLIALILHVAQERDFAN